MQPDYPVHLRGKSLVVGCHQRSAALAADEVEELTEHRVGGVLVEVAGRLVGEHQRRLVGERAGDRNALLLTAGELGRTMVQTLSQSERAKQLPRPLMRGLHIGTVHQLRKDDILHRVELRKQMVKLVDEAEQLAPEPGAPLVVQLRCFLALQSDGPLKSAFEQADGLKQRRLSRARRAQ